MLSIDHRSNITAHKGDNLCFNFCLCNEKLGADDIVELRVCTHIIVKAVVENGIAKFRGGTINLEPGDYRYSIYAMMKDGRHETVLSGKFTVKGGC